MLCHAELVSVSRSLRAGVLTQPDMDAGLAAPTLLVVHWATHSGLSQCALKAGHAESSSTQSSNCCSTASMQDAPDGAWALYLILPSLSSHRRTALQVAPGGAILHGFDAQCRMLSPVHTALQVDDGWAARLATLMQKLPVITQTHCLAQGSRSVP